jgi:hypothetical protein
MKEWVNVSIDGSYDEYLTVCKMLRKNRQALDIIFEEELGHACDISDCELISDALRYYLHLTRKAVGVVREKGIIEA